VIVDLMHGLFKSTVHCPDCDRVSVTFEPYMNISLPIPEVKLLHRHFFWVPFDTSKRCVLHSFSVRGHRQVRHLKKLIGQVFGVSGKAFELVLIFDSRVQKMLPDFEPIASVLNNNHAQTLFAFEADPRSIRRKYR
jgi:ubiquitin carboxyl-terminal hydrolase 4/11/15